jgi:prepilin-type N-terminal cleavage/methylation domain-containing protein
VPRSGAMARRIVRDQEGVTLTELLIVISLLSVVVIAAYLLFDAVSGMADLVEAKSRATDQTKLAMERIIRELRQAQEIQDGGGAFAANLLPTDMSFYANVDRSSEAPELVRYRQSGVRLLRSVRYATVQVPPYGTYLPATPTETVVLSMMDLAITPVFAGLNTSETVTADKALISSVEIKLKNGATAGRRTSYCEMTTKVKVRSVQNAIK